MKTRTNELQVKYCTEVSYKTSSKKERINIYELISYKVNHKLVLRKEKKINGDKTEINNLENLKVLKLINTYKTTF